MTKTKHKLVFATGGKGGVGKTIALLSLLDAISAAGLTAAVVDADRENAKAGGLADHVAATTIDLRDKVSCDKLLTLAAENSLTVCDLPANAGGDFLEWFSLASDPAVLEELDLSLYAVGVINPTAASVASVLKWAESLQDAAAYVIALNRRSDDRTTKPIEDVFADYYKSPAAKKFRAAASPIEVEIPGLYEFAAKAWSKVGGLASEAAENPAIPILDRSRLRKFAVATIANWQPLIDVLRS